MVVVVAICGGVSAALWSGSWIVGVITCLMVGGVFDERVRHRRDPPRRGALIEFARKDGSRD
jgi:hypothetical protein